VASPAFASLASIIASRAEPSEASTPFAGALPLLEEHPIAATINANSQTEPSLINTSGRSTTQQHDIVNDRDL
jgi:hypothetical protein